MADLKRQIIAQLNLQHVTPEQIGNDQPLFVEGLGLDSIDALELIVLLQQEYNIKLNNAGMVPSSESSYASFAAIMLSKAVRLAEGGSPVKSDSSWLLSFTSATGSLFR